MSWQSHSRHISRSTIPPAEGKGPREPTLVEDLLLLLFQPASGSNAGEAVARTFNAIIATTIAVDAATMPR